MKKYIVPLLLVVLFAACKKKEDPVYTSFTLYVDGDSTWTTTNVTAEKQSNGSVIVSANNSTAHEKVTFTLLDYREGRKTYSIGLGTVPGFSYGSAAAYDYSGFRADGTSGQVAINNLTTRLIEGTFDVATNKVRISGHFGAPLPK